jgi:predicted transcriptional regulator of viral defense system
MNLPGLLRLIGSEPVFSSALLLAGRGSLPGIRLQLSRWVRSGRLLQLRRGVYALAPPWRKVDPHPFLVANALQRGSYVSLQAALSFHGLIPEHAPVVTSVGPGRPQTIPTALGDFQFNHVASRLIYGYTLTDVAPGQRAFVATPEKALLDLVYLTRGGDDTAHLESLRLQQPDAIHPAALMALAERSGKPRLRRAAARTLDLLRRDTEALG